MESAAARGGVLRVVNGEPLYLTAEFAYAEPLHDEWEKPVYRRFKDALASGMVVLDVGASFGLYAIGAARGVGRSGRVFAFEPARRTAASLRRHLEWNRVADRVEVVEAVAADVGGHETFWEQETSFLASLDERAARHEEHRFDEPVEPRVVRSVTLDDFCRSRGVEPDVVKIDVEGSEARVLRGACALLARRKAVLFFEVHDDVLERAGGSPDDVFRELAAAEWGWEELHAERATRHFVAAPR